MPAGVLCAGEDKLDLQGSMTDKADNLNGEHTLQLSGQLDSAQKELVMTTSRLHLLSGRLAEMVQTMRKENSGTFVKSFQSEAVLEGLRQENEELRRQLAIYGRAPNVAPPGHDRIPTEPQVPSEAAPMLRFPTKDVNDEHPIKPGAVDLPGMPDYIDKDSPLDRSSQEQLCSVPQKVRGLVAAQQRQRIAQQRASQKIAGRSIFSKESEVHPEDASLSIRNSTVNSTATGTQQEDAGNMFFKAAEGAHNIKRRFRASRTVFADPESLKEQAREIMNKPQYRVQDFYHTAGCWASIARSSYFDNITLAMIVANAIWLAIDTDYNESAVLLHSQPGFLIAEVLFTTFFTAEITIRYMAFFAKVYAFRDTAFVFDAGLVSVNLLETVAFTILLAITGASTDQFQSASLLRLFRLLRLARMARVIRLLRAMPELMILCRGILVASRAVFFTLALLVLLVYVFAVCFKQLTDDTALGRVRFNSVLDAMNFLLLTSMVPDLVDVVEELGGHSFFLGALYMFFILLAALTVMNMLVGVLVEVVGIVSKVEREELMVMNVKSKLSDVLQFCDNDHNRMISRFEFESLVVNEDAVKVIQELGVDVVGLVDYIDFVFQDQEELSFSGFMELVLQLRGTNGATVKDVVDLRKYLHETMGAFERRLHERLPDPPKELRTTEVCEFPRGVRASEITQASLQLTSHAAIDTLQPSCEAPIKPVQGSMMLDDN